VLLSSLLFLCNSSDASEPSVHPTVPRVSPVYQLVRRLHRCLLYRYHRFIQRCDAPGFQSGLLTLTNRSTALSLVKRRSTWAITSKTSPTIPNDTPWSTSGQGLVKTLVKPLEHPIVLQCQPKLLPRSPNFT
jgi:hypothetical protein